MVLGTSRYAIHLDDVVEVLRAVAITPLPGAPAIVEGVINLRGRVVPVLDLRRRFGHGIVPPSAAEHLVVARAGQRIVGFRAEPDTTVAGVAADDIERGERVVASGALIEGIVRLRDGVALLHDLERFLTQAESAGLDEAVEGYDAPAGRA